MDKNKELDNLLKQKLNNKIDPSPEFELKVIRRIEKEKQKVLEERENDKTKFKKVNTQEKNIKQNGERRYRHNFAFAKVLSMAAIVVVVFTLSMNLKNDPIIGSEENANLVSIKAIEPTKSESGVLANNSEFIIQAEGENLNTEVIQKSIYVEPALDYTIEKTVNKNEYKLTFKQNIPDNTIVKLQYIKNQITEDSWAYQTSNKLSVTRTYPAENDEDITKNSVIEVEFSYANVENFEQNVSIYPNVKGSWKNLGNVWRFIPKANYEENQQYTVKIKKGIKAGKETLKDDYNFKFFVGNSSYEAYQNSVSLDKIIISKPNELVKIPFGGFNPEETKFGKIEIAKFANSDDFINYLEDKNYDKAIKQNEYEVNQVIQDEQEGYLEFKNTLTKGYYVAKVKNQRGKQIFNCPIQISEISAYALETERDVIIWVAKGNELAKNVNVEYLGKQIETDNQGIAKFEGIIDNSKKLKYAKIENELIIGIYNYSFNEYPNSYIYTDRPLYKNTDTINIWGFIPRKLFYDNIEDDFYIRLGAEEKHKVNVAPNGNFTYKLPLKNHLNEDSATLYLYYKDTFIASRSISIKNYELQNYIYEPIIDKKYAKDGETINFGVKVSHITGLVVPNKRVTITSGENYKDTQITGDDGIAHFKMKLDKLEEERSTLVEYQEIAIHNGDENEYTDSESYLSIAILPSDTYAVIDESQEGEYKLTIHKLNQSKNTDLSWDIHELYDGTYETKVNIRLRELSRKRVITGYTYNEYTKENEPEYEFQEEDNYTDIKTVISKNGIVEVNNSELKIKENTEDIEYYYYIEFLYKDISGRQIKEFTNYQDKNIHTQKNKIGYFQSNDCEAIYGNSDRLYEIENGISIPYNYHTYRYLLKHKDDTYNIGEKIDFSLAESQKDGIHEIENQGKLLTVAFKENIMETNILTTNKFSHEYTNKDFPGFKMTSAYFINGKFYRMPIEYFDFDKEKRKLDVEITPDKEEYRPGDTVVLNISTTNSGKPIQTSVNISVVNESVFELEDDETNLLAEIYKSKHYAAYSYSSYLDCLEPLLEGGAGGGGDTPRINFADTAYFELVSTDRSGKAKVSFKLPDNVTTYRVTAHAVNEDLYLGVNTKKVTSKLDFFIQSPEPRGIKTTDDVVLNATAIADTKYDVNYTFTIKEINKTLKATGKTNNIVSVNFGKLPFGTYHAVIKGSYKDQEDSIEYEFKVVETLQEVSKKTTMNIQNNTIIKPSKNPIVLEIYNNKMSKYMEYIDFIENTQNERLDTQIAYNKVQELKEKYYGYEKIVNQIQISLYEGDNNCLKNLRSGKEDFVLTALTEYYANNYKITEVDTLLPKDNVFEYYLIASAEGKPVLQDLKYLKEEANITNYSKLLVTLSLEFIGDYADAKELYKTINLSKEEESKYKSIVAIIETFINKKDATSKIDELIKNRPADEYLRFAILSYFKNNSVEMEKEETVKVKTSNAEKNLTIKGMKVETLTLNNEELSDIIFETQSKDLMISYYYQTLLENIEGENIKKDIKVRGSGELKKGNTVYLNIEFEGNYEGEVRIALPNGVRLAYNYNTVYEDAKYYIQSNNIDYITIYKLKNCKSIRLPLTVINEGKYKFESIVSLVDGIYHISNPINLNIK